MVRPKKERSAAGGFGRLVRQHRERLGISISELARVAMTDQGLLSKIERGLRPPPHLASPTFHRIAARFGFDPSSNEYKELAQTAYQERFGEALNAGAHIPTITLLVSKTPSPVGGLGGLPPAMIPPDSAAGQYYRSKGIEVGKALDVKIQPKPGAPASPTKGMGGALAPLPAGSASLLGLTSMGIDVLQFSQDKQGGVRGVMRLPDGQEYDFAMTPKRRRISKKKTD